MAFTVTEANAFNRLAAWVVGSDRPGVDPPSGDDLEAVLTILARAAHKTLGAGLNPTRIAELARNPLPRSAIRARTLADAVDGHMWHGGSLPWPKIRRAWEAWTGRT